MSSSSEDNTIKHNQKKKQRMMMIHKPIDADVLCGRGRAIRAHPGNQVYISLIQDRKAEYCDAPKGWKQDIVRKVVNEIRDGHGGRFLQREQGKNYWTDIGEQKALAKTAQAFRDLKDDDDDDEAEESRDDSEGRDADATTSNNIVGKKKNNASAPVNKNQKRKLPVAVTMNTKKSKGLPSFSFRHFGGGRKPKLAKHGHNFDPTPSSSSEEESSSSSSDDDGEEDGGDVSETETEDSFPVSSSRVR